MGAHLEQGRNRFPTGLSPRARLILAGSALLGLAAAQLAGQSTGASAASTPIRHVVIIYQENHSFDNVLGLMCVREVRCNGVTSGVVDTGETVPLTRPNDKVPREPHGHKAEVIAMDNGKMDGFSKYPECAAATGYKCYAQYQPDQIPNLWSLADGFAISDNTFELKPAASFPSHIEVVGATTDGFIGGIRPGTGTLHGPGWGCNSGKDAKWRDGSGIQYVPTCVPMQDGSGPYRPSPVSWVPTIMDRLDAAGLPWHIYAPSQSEAGYNWAVCPTFAECIYTDQAKNVREPSDVITDAQDGTLGAFSVVIPKAPDSQHNNYSMAQGDNWIGSIVSAIEHGPDWSSTTILITYDDCGCFYDHVAPPKGFGLRVPMVIVSPYAKPRFVDSNQASFASMLAYTEHIFGLAPLNSADASAYDYADVFDYSQVPNRPIPMVTTTIPPAELRWIAAHPMDPNDND